MSNRIPAALCLHDATRFNEKARINLLKLLQLELSFMYSSFLTTLHPCFCRICTRRGDFPTGLVLSGSSERIMHAGFTRGQHSIEFHHFHWLIHTEQKISI